jgi:hypothetical protein
VLDVAPGCQKKGVWKLMEAKVTVGSNQFLRRKTDAHWRLDGNEKDGYR